MQFILRELGQSREEDRILDIGELVVQFLVGAVIPNRPMERLEHGPLGTTAPT